MVNQMTVSAILTRRVLDLAQEERLVRVQTSSHDAHMQLLAHEQFTRLKNDSARLGQAGN